MRHMWQQTELARVGLLESVKLHREDERAYWKPLVRRTFNTKQAWEQIIQEGDFPMATTVDEGDAISYSGFFTGNTKNYYPVMRALGYSVSKLARHTDLMNVVSKPSKKMSNALLKTKEQKAANVFVNHISTSYTGPDGKPLVATDHPTRVGVSTNRPATDITLGYLTLAQALQECMNVKSHEGDPYPITGPFSLLTRHDQADLAHRVCEPIMNKMPESADNDKAWASGQISKVLINPYLTSTTAWWLISDDDNPVFILNRIPLFAESDYDMDRQKYKFVVGEEYDINFDDWRGIWGTTG